MQLDANGYVSTTEVDGSTLVGLIAADGSINIVDATAETTNVGVYHASGAYNVTVVDGTANVGAYAANGSLNVITGSTSVNYGLRHPCGALNVTSTFA